MTRELLGFFAPPKELMRSALIASGIAAVPLLLHLDSLSLPALSLWFAWWLSGSFSHIAIQPVACWDRAWPVPHRLLLRTRIVAAWLASGVPTLALAITASALHGLGVVSEAAWARTVLHALCVLGLVPLACAASYRLSDRPQGSPGHVAALVLLPALALEASVRFYGLDESRSVATLFGSSLVVGGFTALVGVLLTRAWVEAPELEFSAARQRHSSSVQPDTSATGKRPFRSAWHGPFWFFFLNARWYAVLAWVYFLLVGVLAHFFFPGVSWFISTLIWFHVYTGRLQPSPLPTHLPVSRQRVLVYLLAPLAVFLASGLALEQFWPPTAGGFAVGRYSGDRDSAGPYPKELYRINAPSHIWRASWGEPPLITTPEGVSRRPDALAVLPGLPLNVYNPYDARLDDDPAFVNYQASRIMTREWNLDVSAADVERACHAVQQGRMGRWCLDEQLGKNYERPRMWLAIECWLLCIITLLSLQMQVGGQGARYKALKWLSLLWVVPTLFALPLALGEVGKNDPTGPVAFPFRGAVLLGELTRLVERAPLASSILGLVLLLSLYRYVERAFVRMEGFVGRVSSQRSAR